MIRERDKRGIQLWNAAPEQVKPMVQDIMAGVAEGALRPTIGREMPLADAAAAQVAVLAPGAYGWQGRAGAVTPAKKGIVRHGIRVENVQRTRPCSPGGSRQS